MSETLKIAVRYLYLPGVHTGFRFYDVISHEHFNNIKNLILKITFPPGF